MFIIYLRIAANGVSCANPPKEPIETATRSDMEGKQRLGTLECSWWIYAIIFFLIQRILQLFITNVIFTVQTPRLKFWGPFVGDSNVDTSICSKLGPRRLWGREVLTYTVSCWAARLSGCQTLVAGRQTARLD